MLRRGAFGLSGAVLCLSAFGLAALDAATPQMGVAATSSPADARAIVNRYCVTCHNSRAKTGGLVLEAMDFDKVAEDGEVWERVVRKLRAGAMPPVGAPRPESSASDALATWFEATLDRSASDKPNPGAPAVHRLNRAEYANAIRDLLSLDVDASTLLPPDDSSSG